MAVYTEVNDEALRAFLAGYGLGELLSYKGIAEGVENSNFLLRTTSGSFILTLYEKRVAEADLPFFLELMRHLSARGLNCPQPVLNRDGVALGVLAGRPAAIVTFLDGVWIRAPKVSHCAALGEALAHLHAAGADFSMRRVNALSLDAWPKLAEAAGERANTVVPDLTREIAEDLAVLQAAWPKDLPRGVIHADLFPDNVFFVGEDLSGLIDFYFACTDDLAYDLSICLNAWCFERDGSFNLTKGRALLGSYTKVRPLTPAEVEAFPILARGSAMRFMLTRLVDWLNVPPGALVKPKDPREYLTKLRFHRGVSHASAYGLPE